MRVHTNPQVQSHASDIASEINYSLSQRRVPVGVLLSHDDLLNRLTSRDYHDSPEDDALDVAVLINDELLAQADLVGERDAVEEKLLDYIDLVFIILRGFVSLDSAQAYLDNNADKAGVKTLALRL